LAAVRQCVGDLAAQLGASLRLLHAADDDAGRQTERASPRPTAQALPSWSVVPPALTALQPGSADVIVIVGARRGALGWQPALDRLPRLVAAQFTEANLIIAYPPRGARRARGDGRCRARARSPEPGGA
jgi:hypothetical protein